MWNTIVIFVIIYGGVYILLMLGHVVNFVWENYMDDFSDRFRAYSKKTM